MKANIKQIMVRKKEGVIPDGEFSCPELENILNAKKKDICTFIIGGFEFDLEVK